MTAEFYKGKLEEDGTTLTLDRSAIHPHVRGKEMTGAWEMEWELEWSRARAGSPARSTDVTTLVEQRKSFSTPQSLFSGTNTDHPEFKMHINRDAYGRTGKLIFDDLGLARKWERIINSSFLEETSENNLKDVIVSQMREGLAAAAAAATAAAAEVLLRDMEDEQGSRIYLCSVDSSNRCILYRRDSQMNYLKFGKFTEFPDDYFPAADAAGSLAREEFEVSLPGGGKKTKKRKRKTKKRKGRKRSSRNLKSKNKKYTKRRR